MWTNLFCIFVIVLLGLLYATLLGDYVVQSDHVRIGANLPKTYGKSN